MKIIKVVHEFDPSSVEKEQEYSSIKNYKIDELLESSTNNLLVELDNIDEELSKQVKEIQLKAPFGARFLIENPLGTILKAAAAHQKKTTISIFARSLLYSFRGQVIEQSKSIEIISLKQAKEEYPKTRNLSIGTYTLHPRDSQMLTRLEYFHKNLAMEKDDELIVLLGRMGAKSLRIIEGDISHNSGKANVSANTLKVGGSIDIAMSKKLEKEKDLLVKFEGNAIELEPNLPDKSL